MLTVTCCVISSESLDRRNLRRTGRLTQRGCGILPRHGVILLREIT